MYLRWTCILSRRPEQLHSSFLGVPSSLGDNYTSLIHETPQPCIRLIVASNTCRLDPANNYDYMACRLDIPGAHVASIWCRCWKYYLCTLSYFVVCPRPIPGLPGALCSNLTLLVVTLPISQVQALSPQKAC